jgi:hypothetical protein
MKRLLVILIWLPLVLINIFISFAFFNYRGLFLEKILAKNKQIYSLAYTPLSRVLGLSTELTAEGKTIKKYLSFYQSPMKNSVPKLIEACNQYNIDPFLVVGIAQCETNLGKKSYQDCFNPFGLGIHSKGRLCFNNWEDSYFKMAKVLRNDYYDKGLNTIEQIMEVYCPNSLKNGGSWARCVTKFENEARNF